MFKYSVIIALTFIIALGAVAETDPVEVLQSTASLEQKVEACRLISISGDVKAIPVLAALLADEQLSHMARYALEPMQEDAAGAALRRALKTTSGKLKAGVVDSLGMRRDVLAVPALIQLLDDDNSFVVEASVRSLGRIAVPEGIEALKKHLVQPDLPYAIMQSLGDGLFAAAEHALAEGNPDSAVPLYDAVYAVETLPVPIRAAALRGAVLARTPQDGLPLLIEAITGENAVFYTVSLRTALEMEDKGNTATGIAAVLPGLSADRKIQVMQTIGELGQNSVGPALLKEAGSGIIPVRVAALDAAVRVAYAPVLPVLRELLSSEDADLLQAARRGLAYFPGKEGDAVVMDMLKSDDVKIRIIAVELISQGALPTPVELLMKIADGDTDDSIRVAAIKGVKEYAGIDQMSGLLSHLFDSHSHDEMIAAEEVLKILFVNEKSDAVPAKIIDALCDSFAVHEGESKLAILRVLSTTGNSKAFDVALALALKGEGELREVGVRTVCDWPTVAALPTLMDWVETPPRDMAKINALRGAVRLLTLGLDTPEVLLQHYVVLLAQADSSSEKKLILSGLATVSHASALSMVLEQLADESVKAEAVQAAIVITEKLGSSPEDKEVLEKAKLLIPELGGGDGK